MLKFFRLKIMIPDGNMDLHKGMKRAGNGFGTMDSIY